MRRVGVFALSAGVSLSLISCAKFRYDTESEDLLLKRYQSYLEGMEEKGIGFLPPQPLTEEQKKQGKRFKPVATLNYYTMDENWEPSDANFELWQQSFEELIHDGREIVETKRGTYYEYRSKKLKEEGLLAIEQIEAQVNAAERLLTQLRQEHDDTRTSELLEEEMVSQTFGLVSEFEESLKNKGFDFHRELDPKKDKLNLDELRGFVDYEVDQPKAKAILLKESTVTVPTEQPVASTSGQLDATLVQKNLESVDAHSSLDDNSSQNPSELSESSIEYQVVLAPGVETDELSGELEKISDHVLFAMEFLRSLDSKDSALRTEFFSFRRALPSSDLIRNFFESPLVFAALDQALQKKEFYGPHESSPGARFLAELWSFDSESTVPTALSFDDHIVKAPIAELLNYYALLSSIEKSYYCREQSDYFLLVRGGARRIKAKMLALESFFGSSRLKTLMPKTEIKSD